MKIEIENKSLLIYYKTRAGEVIYRQVKNITITNLKKIYESVGPKKDGLRYVQDENSKWGFIDVNGNEVIPLIYDDVNAFNCGIAKVRKGEDTFYINTKGEKISGTE